MQGLEVSLKDQRTRRARTFADREIDDEDVDLVRSGEVLANTNQSSRSRSWVASTHSSKIRYCEQAAKTLATRTLLIGRCTHVVRAPVVTVAIMSFVIKSSDLGRIVSRASRKEANREYYGPPEPSAALLEIVREGDRNQQVHCHAHTQADGRVNLRRKCSASY